MYRLSLAIILILAGCGSPTPPKARFSKQIPWIGKGVWLKADTHIHTKFSDGKYPLLVVAEQANNHGCDIVAFTDHADRDRRAATPEYFAQIRQARAQFPDMLIFSGLEWNAPPTGGDEHVTLIVRPQREDYVLSEFKQRFDDLSRPVHEAARANQGLLWLERLKKSDADLPAILFLNHPTRKRVGSASVITDIIEWRDVSPLVVGFSGAPGHQAMEKLGSYDNKLGNSRWDPVAARVGDAWDQLLGSGHIVWGARAASDFHNEDGDYWPGQFSETWVYAEKRTHQSVLCALYDGTFFAAHGHIAREVRLQVAAEGLERSAEAGEIIDVGLDSSINVNLTMKVPQQDWQQNANRIDLIELIAISGDTSQVVKAIPSPGDEVIFGSIQITKDLVLRARGRSPQPDGRDFWFYTNPVTVNVAAKASALDRLPANWLYWFAAIGMSLLLLAAIVAVSRPGREATAQELAGKPPQNWHFAVGALAIMAFSIYASYVPLQPTGITWDDAVKTFNELEWTGDFSRADVAVNVLLLVPISFLMMGTFLVDNRQWTLRIVVPIAVIAICFVLSFSNEFGQLFYGPRTPSKKDLLAQGVGTLVGIITWFLTGNEITQWARSYGVGNRRYRKLEWAFQAYLIGLLIYTLMPFEFALSPADIAKNLRDNLKLQPFADIKTDADGIYQILRDFALFIPIGALFVIWNRPGTSPRRSPIVAIFFGTLVVVITELCQVIVMHRFASVTDVILGAAGVAVGAVLMWKAVKPGTNESGESSFIWPLVTWTSVAILYSVIPFFVYCTPMEWIEDPQIVRERYQNMVGVPFADLDGGSRFIKGSVVLRKLMLFAPIGAFLLLGLYRFATTRTIRLLLIGFIIAVAAGFGLTIELVQLYLVTRYPDIWDVTLYSAGALLGVLTIDFLRSTTKRD